MTASEQTALLKKGEPQSLGVLAMIYQLGSTVLGLYCNGVNMMIMNLVLTILVVDSPATAGLLTSIFNIGQLCGQFFFGPLVDIAGPKVASLSTAAVGVVGAMIAASAGALMPLETQLLIGRFVTGMGNGGEYPVVASLSKAAKAHFTPRQLLTCSMALQFGGNATIQSLYLILIPLGLPPGLFWRSLLAAAGLPPLACFVMRLHLQVPSEADGIASLQQAAAAPSRQVSPGRISGYGVVLRKSWAEKGWAYIAAVLSWSCAHMIIQVTGSYLHVYVDAAAGPNVQPRALLLYNGLQALSVSLMTMFGCFSAFFFLRFMQIEWTQGLCMLMVASLILVEAVLGEEHSLLTLVTVALNSFPQGVVSVTTYTIVAEMFPREAVGFFMGIAGILVFLTALPVATFFPVFIDAYGLGMAELAESFITFLGAMATLSILKLDKSASLKSDSESLSGIGSA